MTIPTEAYLERVKRAAWESYLAQRGERYKECRLSNFLTDEPAGDKKRRILQACEALITKPNWWQRNIILIGSTGTGKDHLLTGLVIKAIMAGCESVFWRSGPALFDQIKDKFSSKASALPTREVTTAKLLAISDVAWSGAELSKTEQQIFYNIVDQRYSARRPIWITANIATREQFGKLVGPHVAERLLQSATVLVCSWPSFRKVYQVIQ